MKALKKIENKISNDIYNEVIKKIKNEYDNDKIDNESRKCIQEIKDNIDNFRYIIVQSFLSKCQTLLINDFKLVNEVKTEIENAWSTQLKNLKIRIEKLKSSDSILKKIGITAAAVGMIASGAGILAGVGYIAGGAITALTVTSASALTTEVVWASMLHNRGHTVEGSINSQSNLDPRINVDEFTIKYTLGKCNINFIE